MAAPNKVGLDYFSFDVDLLRDRKLRKPKMKYGYLATVVYIALLCMIYEDKGYYLDYTDKDDVIWQILEYLQGKYVPDYDTVAEVIACLVECELFSGYHFKQGTITSRRIQRMYYSATASRKTVDIEEDKWLLTMEEMKSLSAKHCYYLKKHNQANNRVNRTNNGVIRPNNLQSKVKESKVKNIVVEVNNTVTDKSGGKSKAEPNQDNSNHQGKGEYIEAVRLLESIKGAPLNGYEIERTVDFVKEYGVDLVCGAFKEMGDCNAFGMRYAQRILEDWRRHGRKKSGGGRSREQKPQGSIMTNETDYSDVYRL